MKVAIFGAGKIGVETYKYYGSEKVECFIDNNRSGEMLLDKKIISLRDYCGIAKDIQCVIATIYYKEIIKQLAEVGINSYELSPTILEKRKPELSENIAHGKWIDYLVELCDKPGKKVLEVGSRNVSGDYFRDKFKHAQYTGFDLYEGPNVDVVGDAHKLSSYFSKGEKFDLIFSSAVFEHFAMPWIVSEQMVKMLNVGGYVFVETHFSYSCHERPWHFFHFTDYGLQMLFSPEMGIKTIESGFSNPIDAKFAEDASDYLAGQMIPFMYCHSEFLGRKENEVDVFNWESIDVNRLVSGTKYPKPL